MKKKTNELDLELTSIPNEKYEKFFAKFQEIKTLEISQWKTVHLLGYFCQKYQEIYGIEYAWKFNNPSPSKCFEVWQLNTLVAKLSKNPQILKDYMDWTFQILVPKAKRRFTSISFLTKDEVVIPYKLNILLGNGKIPNINRSTLLPDQYIDIIKNRCGAQIKSYGELAFLHQMYIADSNTSDNWLITIEYLTKAGFDDTLLSRIV